MIWEGREVEEGTALLNSGTEVKIVRHHPEIEHLLDLVDLRVRDLGTGDTLQVLDGWVRNYNGDDGSPLVISIGPFDVASDLLIPIALIATCGPGPDEVMVVIEPFPPLCEKAGLR